VAAGRIAEIVSGRKFDVLLEERISRRRLGVKDTDVPPGRGAPRAHCPDLRNRTMKPANWCRDIIAFVTASDVSVSAHDRACRRPLQHGSGHGQVIQMILDGGVWKGKRILSVKKASLR